MVSVKKTEVVRRAGTVCVEEVCSQSGWSTVFLEVWSLHPAPLAPSSCPSVAPSLSSQPSSVPSDTTSFPLVTATARPAYRQPSAEPLQHLW